MIFTKNRVDLLAIFGVSFDSHNIQLQVEKNWKSISCNNFMIVANKIIHWCIKSGGAKPTVTRPGSNINFAQEFF